MARSIAACVFQAEQAKLDLSEHSTSFLRERCMAYLVMQGFVASSILVVRCVGLILDHEQMERRQAEHKRLLVICIQLALLVDRTIKC
eukprot:6103529-Amphidinium_carterae.1